MSREKGLESFQTYEGSLNAQRFSSFLQGLDELVKAGPVAVFMDNLRVHHSLIVREQMKAMNIEALFNVPYSPENNPIETVFSLIKHQFKKDRLQHLA